MYLFNFILFALIARSYLAKHDENDHFIFVKRADTGLPDLNEPITQTHIGGHIEGSPSMSHSSNSISRQSIPSPVISQPSTLGDRDVQKAQEKRKRHREYMKVKRKTMKATFENRHILGFSEEKIKEMERIHQVDKNLKNERTRIRNKASRERVRNGNPTRSDLNFVASQRASSKKWHENNPEKAAKAKKAWNQRNPEKMIAAAKKKREKRKRKAEGEQTQVDS